MGAGASYALSGAPSGVWLHSYQEALVECLFLCFLLSLGISKRECWEQCLAHGKH